MRTAVFIGLALVVAAAAGFLAIMYAGPSPLAAAEQYLEQIASRDFAGIEQYFAEDKPHPTSAELEEGFRRFAQAFGLEEIERTQLEAQSEAWRAAEYTYKLRYTFPVL